MATRQPKPKTEIEDEIIQQAAALLDDESFSSESLNPALEMLYADMGVTDGGEAQVYVTLLDADGKGDEANVWRGTPDDYDLERIAKTFGSGKYRVKVYVRNQTGQRVIKGNKVFTWKLTPEEEERRKNPQPVQPAFNPMDLSRVIAESIKAALPPPAPIVTVPPVDPLMQFKQFAEIMQMMRPAEAPQAPAQNTLSSLRDMAELMDMLRGGNDSAPAVGSATGNDLMLKLIDKFGPLFMNVLAQQGQAQAQPHAVLPPVTEPVQFAAQPSSVAQPAPSAPVQPAPSINQQEVDDVNIRLKMGLNFLIQMCDSGGMAETYAEVVLDNVPEETVKQLIESPTPLDILGQFDARIKNEPYAAWFTTLIATCKEMLTDEPEVSNDKPA